jgi:hypothetical protein
VFFYGSFHVRVLLASIGSALLCFLGSLRPFSLLNIYLKRSPPAFFSKKKMIFNNGHSYLFHFI